MLRQAIFRKLREVFTLFSSSVREHYLSFEKEGAAAWDGAKRGAAAKIAAATSPISQWWMPWYTNDFDEAQYRAAVSSLPECCAINTQLAFHRYNRPQWRSRIAPLLPSIYDSRVRNPLLKKSPNFLWCCLGYDMQCVAARRRRRGDAETPPAPSTAARPPLRRPPPAGTR